MAELHEWDVAAANNNSAPPDGFPENMNYSAVNNSAREVMAVLRRHLGDIRGNLVSGGTANAHTLTPAGTYTAYFDGMRFRFEAGNSNTGATTLNVSGLGAANVVKLEPTDGTYDALVAGDIVAGQIYDVVYDGTNTHFLVINPSRVTEVYKRLSSTTAAALASTAHAWQVGPTAGANLIADTAGLQARDNGAAAALEVQRSGGNFIVGPSSGQRIITLPTGVNSDNAGSPSTLALQSNAGAITAGGALTVAGAVTASSTLGVTGAATVGGTLGVTGGVTGASTIAAAADGLIDGTTAIRDYPLTAISASHTLDSSDRGDVLYLTAGAAIEVPADAGFDASVVNGSVVLLVNNTGGALDISGGAATLIGTTTIPNGATAMLIKVATNTWAVFLGA